MSELSIHSDFYIPYSPSINYAVGFYLIIISESIAFLLYFLKVKVLEIIALDQQCLLQ